MQQQGYIKLHRKMLENPICMKDADHFALWVYILLQCTHTETSKYFAGNKIILLPGQFITGRDKIAKDLKINRSKVERMLKEFCSKSEQQIEQQTTPQGRLITVLNWSKYQNGEQLDEQQVSNKRATSEQQVSTNKNVNNIKNVKNKENNFSNEKLQKKKISFAWIEKYPILKNPELKQALADFKEHRKALRRPLTEKATILILNKLIKLAGDDIGLMIAIINQSLEQGWQSVFELQSQERSLANGKKSFYQQDLEDKQKHKNAMLQAFKTISAQKEIKK